MTLDEVNAAIAKFRLLREKIIALETGKYYDLELSGDQIKKMNDDVDLIKTDIKVSASEIAVGVPIEIKQVEGLKDNMKVENLPKIKPKE